MVDPGMAPRETTPDPKPAGRVVDRAAVARFLEQAELVCQACSSVGYDRDFRWIGLSVHHIVQRSKGGDDVPENFAILCGHGTLGCHGGVHHRHGDPRERLRARLTTEQLAYVLEKKGADWLKRQYPERKAA